MNIGRRLSLVLAVVVAPLTGCLPYTVGTTAQTVPMGESQRSVIATVVTNGGEELGDSTRNERFNALSFDVEARRPLSEHSDLGIRIPSFSGVVLNYKRRHWGFADQDSAAFSTMWGGGFINLGQHAHVEGTLLWSGRRRGSMIPYGGARLMQAIPLHRDAAEDDPSAGLFLGFMLGNREFAVGPEFALYYDRSVLGLRPSPWMFIPSITVRDLPLPSLFGQRYPR